MLSGHAALHDCALKNKFNGSHRCANCKEYLRAMIAIRVQCWYLLQAINSDLLVFVQP